MTDTEADHQSITKEDEAEIRSENAPSESSRKDSIQTSTHDEAASQKSQNPSEVKDAPEGEEQEGEAQEGEAQEEKAELKLEEVVEVQAEPSSATDKGGKKKKDKKSKAGGDEGGPEAKKKGKGKKVKKAASTVKADAAKEGEEDQEPPSSPEKTPSATSVQEAEAGKKEKEKKKKGKASTTSMEGGATSESTTGQKKKKDKKKKKKASSVSLEHDTKSSSETGQKKKKGKKKKGKASSTTSGLDEATQSASDTARRNKKDKKKGTTASEVNFAEPKKKKKGKKGKKESISEGEEHVPPKEKSSRSTTSVLKAQHMKSHPSLEQLMSRLSLHVQEMEKLRSKSVLTLEQRSSMFSFGSSGSSESDKEPEETVTKKTSSKLSKKKKKQKDKKGKRKKGAEPSEEDEEGESKKKKKGKGKKAVHIEEEAEPVLEPQVDMMAEIAKMKYLAEMQVSGEESEATSEAPPKKKKKKGAKKKLSKKEKARLAAEAAEKALINAEEEAAKAAELERIRLEQERKAAIEKEKREGFEQQIRMEQLETISEHFRELIEFNKEVRAKAKEEAEWEFYVSCARLPNPSKCDQMNTFLHLWENVVEETSMEDAATKTHDVLELLNELDDLIDTAEKEDSDVVENWKWVRLLFRQQQAKSLDVATYRLLRNIEKNLHRIDIPTADYKYQDENVALCLWLRIQLPTPLPNPRRPAKARIEVKFPEMKMEVQFPSIVDGEKMAVRALYVKYDHLSDLSDSYERPPIPEQYDIDLYTSMKTEWREKLFYKYENRVRKTPPPTPLNEEGQEGQEGETPQGPPPERVIGPDDDVPIVPYRKLEPTASEYVIAHEDELYGSTRTELVKTVPDDVINLRRYSVIGGVYSLNLLHQPPQPQDFVTLEMNLTPLYLPKELELVNLYLDYSPTAPPDPNIRRPPEEIEEEMKKIEEELERLILVTITWPEHVIFLELPMVCYWDEEQLVWSKSEVNDLKHNEEKGQLSFRTRKGATFALAVYRYANLPYQAWEIKPEANGSISLQITAAILMVEFNIKDGQIALSQLQNSPNNALQDIVGTYFSLPKLIRILQSAGVDVFPAFDAFCYIESSCEKHWPMEKNLYLNMAQLSICFNFAWSRWNMAAGRRNIILQMREYNLEKAKQKNHLMLHVTPTTALYVDCTEVSQTFNEEGIENMKFYPDLFHLMKGTTSMAVKNKIANASKELVFALYELLIATRVISFS